MRLRDMNHGLLISSRRGWESGGRLAASVDPVVFVAGAVSLGAFLGELEEGYGGFGVVALALDFDGLGRY